MAELTRDFQVFVKTAGASCNLACSYCYYLGKNSLRPETDALRMPDNVLERYIRQHIETSPQAEIRFSWHGGEPTLAGLDYFRQITAIQQKYAPAHKRILNGIQTNGTLLDEEWCRFFADENFYIGLSMDGPADMHDRYRLDPRGGHTHARVMRAHELLKNYGVPCDILCVVSDYNVRKPEELYCFFRDIGAEYVSFLPLVNRDIKSENGVDAMSVSAEAWGEFLCCVFDEWRDHDIGKLKVRIFEEAARTAFGQEHSLCIFRPVCGDIPVIERNGDFYSCDHYVDSEHRIGNIMETPLSEMLGSSAQRKFGEAKYDSLPRQCRDCEALNMCNGECPKNRFIRTADGEEGLNYLCEGYRRFFSHCREWVSEVASVWNMQTQQLTSAIHTEKYNASRKPGRNDPCPCGSGLKYKKCCLNK